MNATQVFGANAMTSEERRRRQFDGVADVDAAARVWTAASELRERLAALSEAAELPAKPATSAGFYGEDELQGILAMHEQVLDVVDSEPAVTEASVFDLHEIVKGMVEGDDGGDGEGSRALHGVVVAFEFFRGFRRPTPGPAVPACCER